MEYSNFGYATLGRIISNVSGKRYQDYIRREIMLPLGMSSTTYDIFASPKARRSHRLSLAGQRMGARAGHEGRRVRRDGRGRDQRQRLCEMGRLPAFRLAARAMAPIPGRCARHRARDRHRVQLRRP